MLWRRVNVFNIYTLSYHSSSWDPVTSNFSRKFIVIILVLKNQQRMMSKKSFCSGSKFATEKQDLESCEVLYWFPQYLNEVCPFNNQYNFEWKRYLIWRNSETVKMSVKSKERFIFYRPKIVKSVFNICKIFRQPPEVRYLAIDVLDRFLVEHFVKVRETYEDKVKEESLDCWEGIIDRVLKQALLRILTSVQLAMKYSWSCNIISATDIQKVMEILGHDQHYPKRSILKSEITDKTPFTYLEMFFDDFQKSNFFNLKISLHHFFTTCIHVLDVAFIFHQQIYNSLIEQEQDSIHEGTLKRNFSIVSLKADFMVLSASVIFASSVLEDPSNVMSEILLETLCSIGECRESDIQAIGKELLKIIHSI